MKKICYLFAILNIIACNKLSKPSNKKVLKEQHSQANTKSIKDLQYSDGQLEAFLDSVGKLPTQTFADKAAFGADSVFKSQSQLDTTVSEKDLNILKRAAVKGVISVNTAKRIFKNKKIDITCTEKSIFLRYKTGLIPVVYYSFDKNKGDFNEYALCIGDPGHCENAFLYFFKSNKIIARHKIYTRFAPELEYYKDTDGETIVYYGEEFTEGSGIWWFNYYFYKYYNGKLIPILNELQNGNLQSFWGPRVLWLESSIISTNPLTIKMVYYSQFYNRDEDAGFDFGPRIIDDSTVVKYKWDAVTSTLKGQYEKSKISKPQILSYYVEDNELLFINAYYSVLKSSLANKAKRKWTLLYLNEVKSKQLQ